MKVSIIVPFNKDRGYLRYAVDSIESQTYNNIELIVQKGDYGVSKNLNDGIAKATGDLITYLSDDDLLPYNAIEDTVNNFTGDFIHGNAVNFWADGFRQAHIPSLRSPTLKQLLKSNFIHGGTVTYHARCFEGNRFDESLTTGEEYEFNLRLLKQGKELGYIDKLLYLYRRHDQQKSLGNTSNEYVRDRRLKINAIKDKFK